MDPLLDDATTRRLRAAELTYAEVGATRGALPTGYHHLHRDLVIGTGDQRYAAAAAALLGWRMQRSAGVRVIPSAARVDEDVVAVQRLGIGRLAVSAPVRVVYVIAEPRRTRFAYGTLPGHPEIGEEAFGVHLDDQDHVVATVTAFARPGSLLIAAAGPVGRLGQRLIAGRYLRGV